MTKPDIPLKAQIKAGIICMVIDGMEQGDVPFDIKFIAEQTAWLAEIEDTYHVPEADDQIAQARKLLAYIDGLPE